MRAFVLNQIPTIRLVRHQTERPSAIHWNPHRPNNLPDAPRFGGLGAAIHLSGAHVSGHRWTTAYRREIVAIRVPTTLVLVDLLQRLENPPRTFCAPPPSGFMATAATRWFPNFPRPVRVFWPKHAAPGRLRPLVPPISASATSGFSLRPCRDQCSAASNPLTLCYANRE